MSSSYLGFGHDQTKGDPRPPHKRRQVVGNLNKASELMVKGFEEICIDNSLSLGDKGIIKLAGQIRDKPRALRKLQVDGHDIGDKGASELFSVLETNKNLKNLEIGSNRLGGKAMRKCYEMLRVNSTLTYLDLDNNRNIGEVGATLISLALRDNSTLQVLCMNHCSIPEAGLVKIAEQLEGNTSLRMLTLERNQASEQVAIAFAAVLKKNNTLKSLNLSKGTKKMGDEGMAAICKALEVNSGLQTLSLTHSKIKNEGAVQFGIMLTKNKSLRNVDLSDNPLGGQGLVSIAEGMKVNKSVTGLFISQFATLPGREIQNLVDYNRAERNYVEKATFEDVLKDGKAKGPLMRSKIMFIGQGRAGKTATMRALLGEPFDFEWKSTIAASLKEAKVSPRNGWLDVPREEKFKFTKDFAAEIALRDIEDKDKDFKRNIDESNVMVGSNLQGEAEIIVTAPKGDENDIPLSAHLNEEEIDAGVPAAPLEGYKDKKRMFDDNLFKDHREDRDVVKYTLWDYGGQRVFYSLHHLFLTKTGIYVLIFSMKEMLDHPGSCRAYLQFWLNSFGLHAPNTPLLLVGTFRDMIKTDQDVATVSQRIDSLLAKFPFNPVKCDSQGLSFFPISNKIGTGVHDLQDALDNVARSQPQMKMEIPMSWIYIIEYLLSEYGRKFITMIDLRSIAAKYKVRDAMEVRDMVSLFNELGLVIHLTQTSVLQDVVILKPDWLLTSLGRVIRDSEIHKHNEGFIERNHLQEDVRHLFEDGLVSDKFLTLIWNDTQVDYLIDVMKETLLMCPWNFKGSSVSTMVDENGKKKNYFFVPGLITGSKDLEVYDDDELKSKKNVANNIGESEEVARAKQVGFLDSKANNLKNICIFEFAFLPDGVYDRLVCLCVAHSNLLGAERPPVITKELSEISFGKDIIVRLYERKAVETLYMELGESEASMKYAQSSLMIVAAMLQKLKKDIIGEGLSWKVFFPQTAKNFTSYESAINSNLEPWFADISKREYEDKIQIADHIDVDKFLAQLQGM